MLHINLGNILYISIIYTIYMVHVYFHETEYTFHIRNLYTAYIFWKYFIYLSYIQFVCYMYMLKLNYVSFIYITSMPHIYLGNSVCIFRICNLYAANIFPTNFKSLSYTRRICCAYNTYN